MSSLLPPERPVFPNMVVSGEDLIVGKVYICYFCLHSSQNDPFDFPIYTRCKLKTNRIKVVEPLSKEAVRVVSVDAHDKPLGKAYEISFIDLGLAPWPGIGWPHRTWLSPAT